MEIELERERGNPEEFVEITPDKIIIHGHGIARVSNPGDMQPIISWARRWRMDVDPHPLFGVNDDVRVDWTNNVDRDIEELALCVVGKRHIYAMYYLDEDMELHRGNDSPALICDYGREGDRVEWYVHGEMYAEE